MKRTRKVKKDFQIGDKVRIIDRTSGHLFKLNTVGIIEWISPSGDSFKVRGLSDFWWLYTGEIEHVAKHANITAVNIPKIVDRPKAYDIEHRKEFLSRRNK